MKKRYQKKSIFILFPNMLSLFIIFIFGIQKSLASCPIGAIQGPSPNDCYKFLANPKNWVTAEEACATQNGHLASISTVFQNAFIQNEIQALFYNVGEVWIGGNTLVVSGTWKWSDNSNFSYTNWGKGEPSSSQNSCISFNAATGSWFARSCSADSLPYVCKVNATTDNSGYTCPTLPVFTCPAVTCPTPPPCSPCKNGYTYHNMTGNCYKLYSNISFDLGETRCNQDGAHLASIHSDEENEFITNFAYDPPGAAWKAIWIGLHYLNGYWQWTDQTPLDYTHYGCNGPFPVGSGSHGACFFLYISHSVDSCGDWYSFWNNNIDQCNTPLTFAVCKYKP